MNSREEIISKYNFICDPDVLETVEAMMEEYAHQSGPSEDKIIDAHLAGQANAGCKHPSYSEARAYLITLESSPVVSSGEGMAEAWVIEYDNDTGPGDEYFVEWFNVTNGEKSFRCNTKEDAEFLLASLSSPGSGWVKVEDGLPEIPPPYFENGLKLTPLGCRVIVYDSVSKEVYEANYYDGHFDDNNPDITHWQPLPTPPGVEDNQTKKQ